MKPGMVLKLKSGRTIKTIPNITQIINQQNSCAGCCFKTSSGCEAVKEKVVTGEDLACGSTRTEPIDEQVIYVEVPTDAENSDGSLVVDSNGMHTDPDQTP